LLGCCNPAGEFDTEMFPEEPVGAVMRERSRDRWKSKGRVVLEYNKRYFSTEPSQKRERDREE